MTKESLSKHPALTPLSIGNTKIKNRLAVAAMVTDFCDTEGFATERYIDYHEARAKGGWGLIITENYAVSPYGRGFWTPGLWKDEQIAGHADLVKRIHQYGTKVLCQIYHAGRQTTPAVIGCQPVAASALPCPVLCNEPRELTIPEIKEIVGQFGDTALRAKKAGFDGVEVHGAHGYLIAQFMSNYSNKRYDEFGGSLHNRLRFPLEIIADIRKKCGNDFTICFRISANEQVPGGRDIEETKLVATKLEAAGIDAIHVSIGVYESTWAIIPPLNMPKAWIVDYAEAVKKVVNIPVITVGRIIDPGMADTIIASGKADVVAMGRASLADPAIPNKFIAGDCEAIRACIGCQQGCVQVLFRNEPIRCLVNPVLGFEYLKEKEIAMKQLPKKVVVVGGGPAGMQAAIAASEAGNEVTLYEQKDRLGGEFALASIPPYKGDMSLLLAWQLNQLKRLGVNVKLEEEFTPALAEKMNADTIILATGAIPVVPDIPGIDLPNVVLAQDVLKGKAKIGQRVLVAGGGLIGAETATYCAARGCEVGIVEKGADIAVEEEMTRRGFLLGLLADKKVKILTNTQISKIGENAATLESGGTSYEYPLDTVVLAVGMEANNPLEASLTKGKAKVMVIGDAVAVRGALEATREGYIAGMNV